MDKSYYTNDYIFLAAGYCAPEQHRHFAKHLLIAINEEMVCKIENKTVKCKGIIIQSNVMHNILYKPPLLLFLIDETSDLSHRIDACYLHGKTFSIMHETIVQEVIEITNKYQSMKHIGQAILSLLELPDNIVRILDERVLITLSVIDQSETIDRNIYHTICEVTHLSQSRLSHMFREQVATSLASYLVLAKFRKTYEYILSGENITQASVRAGFDSPSHFAAACKRMFGNAFTTLIE